MFDKDSIFIYFYFICFGAHVVFHLYHSINLTLLILNNRKNFEIQVFRPEMCYGSLLDQFTRVDDEFSKAQGRILTLCYLYVIVSNPKFIFFYPNQQNHFPQIHNHFRPTSLCR